MTLKSDSFLESDDDVSARFTCKHRLQAAIRRIARHVILGGRAATRIEKCILSEAKRMEALGDSHNKLTIDAIVAAVSQRLIELIPPRMIDGKQQPHETKLTDTRLTFTTMT